MTKPIRIRDCAFPPLTPLPPDDFRFDETECDKHVNRCVTAVTDCLSNRLAGFGDLQRENLIQIFNSMRATHYAVRELIHKGFKNPISVNAMPLVRGQLETVYSLSLIAEQPEYLDLYLKSGWKQMYVGQLLLRQQFKSDVYAIANMDKTLGDLAGMQRLSGVADEERATIDFDELGVPLPNNFTRKTIGKFPTPGGVVPKIINNAVRTLLTRLYPDCQNLCVFVHGAPLPRMFAALLDPRQQYAKIFPESQIEDLFQREFAVKALWTDLLSIVQCCTEFVPVFPSEVELRSKLVEAWSVLTKYSFVGQIAWSLRSKECLGIVG
jgi:hypothetical protein